MSDLPQLVQDFLDYLQIERNCSPLTIRDYRHYLEKFLAWAQKNNIASPENITLDQVRRYRVFLANFQSPQDLPLKRVTQNYYVIALRAFLRYLIRNDVKTLAPEKIELPKTESHSLKFLDGGQIERLLSMPIVSEIDGLRDKAIMETLFSTGLRVSELVKLNRDQINFERREFGIIGKGGHARVVFLSDEAVRWLKQYLDFRQDQFKPLLIRYSGTTIPENNGEKMRLTSRSIQRIIDKYVKKAKLPVKASPHTLRHSFATDLLMAGADIRSVQEMLGHKNISTTQIYTHITNKQLKEVHRAFHLGNKIGK